MRLLTADCIVLSVTDLHDRDRIVSFLTADHGRKRGVAQGARTRHSRFGGQLQSLARTRMTWFEKDGRDLVRIREAALERPARGLDDLEGILLGQYMAEHMEHFAQVDEESEHFLRLLDSTLRAIGGGVHLGLAARYFEAWVLRLTGIFPAPWACPECGSSLDGGAVLPHDGGGVVCRRCAPAGLAVPPEAVQFLRVIGRTRLTDLAASPPAPWLLDRVEEICGRVRRGFLQQELKSYRVMRDTLAGLAPAGPPSGDARREETDE